MSNGNWAALARIAVLTEREAANDQDVGTRANLLAVAAHLRASAGWRSGLQPVEEVRR